MRQIITGSKDPVGIFHKIQEWLCTGAGVERQMRQLNLRLITGDPRVLLPTICEEELYQDESICLLVGRSISALLVAWNVLFCQ